MYTPSIPKLRWRNGQVGRAALALAIAASSGATMAAECVARPVTECSGAGCGAEPPVVSAEGLPRLTLSDFQYVGAFTFPGSTYGDSSLQYATPIMEQAGSSLFIAGHNHHDAIAEFVIPELVNSTNVDDLNSTGDPVQDFTRILERPTSGNPDGLDQITGMEIIDGKLVVNAITYYDGDGRNTDSTLVINQAANLSGSSIDGYLHMPGAARSAGWISGVPPEWQSEIGAPYISGFSSATSIISRHSVGPSAHALDPQDLFSASASNPEIETTQLLEFSIDEPLNDDLKNEGGQNDIWTFTTGAWYGFIVPGTRTYATFGYAAGMDSGIGYKITQSDGNRCGGYCPYDADDEYTYYWLFDVEEMLAVKNGERQASSLRPYEYGKFPAPFQPDIGANRIQGGTFDASSGTLYLSLNDANLQGSYSRTPVVVAYRFPGL